MKRVRKPLRALCLSMALACLGGTALAQEQPGLTEAQVRAKLVAQGYTN